MTKSTFLLFFVRMIKTGEKQGENPIVTKFFDEFVHAIEADHEDPKTRFSDDLGLGCPNTRAVGLFVNAVTQNPELVNELINATKEVLKLNETPGNKFNILLQLIPSLTLERIAARLVDRFPCASNAEKVDIEGFKKGFRAAAVNDTRLVDPGYREGALIMPGQSATDFLLRTIRFNPNVVRALFNAIDEVLKANFREAFTTSVVANMSYYYKGKALVYETIVRALVDEMSKKPNEQASGDVVVKGRGKIKSLASGILDKI